MGFQEEIGGGQLYASGTTEIRNGITVTIYQLSLQAGFTTNFNGILM